VFVTVPGSRARNWRSGGRAAFGSSGFRVADYRSPRGSSIVETSFIAKSQIRFAGIGALRRAPSRRYPEEGALARQKVARGSDGASAKVRSAYP